MIRRPHNGGWLLIRQPAHAHSTGQMAAAWGNQQYVAPLARDAVILGTTLHDIGWLGFDAAPQINNSGQPLNFVETSLEQTNRTWRVGVADADQFDHYAALLVLMHAQTIYSQRLNRGANTREDVADMLDWLDEQRQHYVRMLGNHPVYAQAVEQPYLDANYRVLRVCDLLSLAMCTGPLGAGTIEDVPIYSASARTVLHYEPVGEHTLSLDPYPFSAEKLILHVSGRFLAQQRYDNEVALHATYMNAPVQTLSFDLVPANTNARL